MEAYMIMGSWNKLKKIYTPPADLTPKQFHHDKKVLYGAIKSATHITNPNNKYLVIHKKDKDRVET